MEYPLVSVIIPVFNRENTVADSITSVLNQTYKKIEIIVVDDGSTDSTSKVLKQFKGLIVAVYQENGGVSSARNKGIQISSGEIITFLDSDDNWYPHKVEKQVTLMNTLGSAISCCWCNVNLKFANGFETNALENGNISIECNDGVWLNPLEFFSSNFLLINQSIAIRKQYLDQAGLYDENLKVLEDMDFAIRLGMLGKWAFIKEPLCEWKGGTYNSLTEDAKRDKYSLYKNEAKVLKKYLINKYPIPLKVKICIYIRYYKNVLLVICNTKNKNNFMMPFRYFLYIAVRYIYAVYSRTPFFPKMNISPTKHYLKNG